MFYPRSSAISQAKRTSGHLENAKIISATCKKVGFIVPSSNTAVEPITQAIFQSLNEDIICIFTRIKVKTVGTDAKSTSQFSIENMVEAAQLLADSEPDCIIWNGTSGMWVGTGLEEDRKLAKAMQDATGIPCSTTTIATIEALEHLQAKKMSIAVPYTEALTAKVAEFYTGCGYEVVKTTRLGNTPASNLEIGRSDLDDIKDVIRRSATPDSKVINVACTNWPATGLVEELEQELGILIMDSISVTTWWALRLIGLRKGISGWGRLLAQHHT
ncbi:hypothetical protein LTR37_005075 [Vermiconidia calcicola]|uniref:Uncharacterized protein n=1 Tax=Vermiconidia calcicola TaxID=1690605 RepID=A0ACC3NKT2_9PEZI|nr:hypothetical protein LTR37_005075 [Vermiconidia calcicola]